jgi:capsular polysaccharide biosynthesis protein
MQYPKPISFYQHPDFEGERARPVRAEWDTSKLTFFGGDEHLIARAVSPLKAVRFRRSGRLMGDYVFLSLGGLALDRDGTPIKIHTDSDDDTAQPSAFSQIEQHCQTQDFAWVRQQVVNSWDTMERYDNIPVLSENYAYRNYYHFSIKFLPLVRHFQNSASTEIGLPNELMQKPFQRQLIVAALGHRRVVPMTMVLRVKNPQLVYDPVSRDGLKWLQDSVGKRARKGERRIFVDRAAPPADLKGTNALRKGGNIAKDAAFRAFLEKHRFEIVNFGSGDVPVNDQIAMIDGARVIMSAHGANLTNIVYAEPGVSVIEVLPIHWTYHSHMQIALGVDLNYVGVIGAHTNAEHDMIADTKLLSQALEAALDR